MNNYKILEAYPKSKWGQNSDRKPDLVAFPYILGGIKTFILEACLKWPDGSNSNKSCRRHIAIEDIQSQNGPIIQINYQVEFTE